MFTYFTYFSVRERSRKQCIRFLILLYTCDESNDTHIDCLCTKLERFPTQFEKATSNSIHIKEDAETQRRQERALLGSIGHQNMPDISPRSMTWVDDLAFDAFVRERIILTNYTGNPVLRNASQRQTPCFVQTSVTVCTARYYPIIPSRKLAQFAEFRKVAIRRPGVAVVPFSPTYYVFGPIYRISR